MPVKTFFCYAHEDEPLLIKLKSHLIPLKRQGLIDYWYDRDINAGAEWEPEISKHLNEAQLILLLVSPAFMASDYINNVELKRAVERHTSGKAYVIPIILRHVYWRGEPIGKLQVLPTDGKPVISLNWHDEDEAFFNIVEGIRIAVEKLINRLNQLTQPTADETSLDQAFQLTNVSPSPNHSAQPLQSQNVPPVRLAVTQTHLLNRQSCNNFRIRLTSV